SQVVDNEGSNSGLARPPFAGDRDCFGHVYLPQPLSFTQLGVALDFSKDHGAIQVIMNPD
ncbi:MAG: hypothetical protein ACP5JJ_02640, partial [Anaerolineae bacterium]